MENKRTNEIMINIQLIHADMLKFCTDSGLVNMPYTGGAKPLNHLPTMIAIRLKP